MLTTSPSSPETHPQQHHQASQIPRLVRTYTPSEETSIQQHLSLPIPPGGISYRSASGGGQGGQVAYLEGWRAFNFANEIFGFNGWSSEILYSNIDVMDLDASGRVSVGVSCKVRVSLKDGAFHEDIGFGSAENQKSKCAAIDKARKEAVTDGIKRVLRLFGPHLGNCCYDKDYLREIKNQPKRPVYSAPPLPPMSNASAVHAAPRNAPVFQHSSNVAPVIEKQDVIMTEDDLLMDTASEPVAPKPSFLPVQSPNRMRTFQPPTLPNAAPTATMRQPDFVPFNPAGQPSTHAGEFVKWNPSNLNNGQKWN